jgi:Na+/H+-translocating membrane pyrophosphatase
MTEASHPLESLTDQGLEALLMRALRIIVGIGVVASLILWIASGWRNAAMMATGAAISAASIFEWMRLTRFIRAKMDRQQTPQGALVASIFFVFRLIIFAGVLYVSLRCFRGSVVALLCGLGLAILAMAWEAIGLLRS